MELNKKKGQHYGAMNLQSVHKEYRKYKTLARGTNGKPRE